MRIARGEPCTPGATSARAPAAPGVRPGSSPARTPGAGDGSVLSSPELPDRGAPRAGRVPAGHLRGPRSVAGQVQRPRGVVRVVVQAGDGEHELVDGIHGHEAVEGDDARCWHARDIAGRGT